MTARRLSDDDIIEALLSELESDPAMRTSARRVLRACVDAIYGEERYSQVRDALSGMRPGPWLDRVECVVFNAGDAVMNETQRGELHGAMRLMRYHLASQI